ncbi:MAG: cyclase family protein [Nitrospirae bacterium]|nr:cyclase family protein [Nitrospirota bacterium]
MHIYDISLTISPELPVWPGDPAVLIERIAKIEDGANANVSMMNMGVHTGTHVDAPFHFLPEGNGVEHLPLDILVGPSFVLDLQQEVDVITSQILEKSNIPADTRRLLIKTRNSRYWNPSSYILKGEEGTMLIPPPLTGGGKGEGGFFQSDFVGITKDGAEFLVSLGIQLIGIDYLSVAPYKQSRPTHEVFLKAGVVVVEGLNLYEIQQGYYTLYCLPLKIAGSDGAPGRAILISE